MATATAAAATTRRLENRKITYEFVPPFFHPPHVTHSATTQLPHTPKRLARPGGRIRKQASERRLRPEKRTSYPPDFPPRIQPPTRAMRVTAPPAVSSRLRRVTSRTGTGRQGTHPRYTHVLVPQVWVADAKRRPLFLHPSIQHFTTSYSIFSFCSSFRSLFFLPEDTDG